MTAGCAVAGGMINYLFIVPKVMHFILWTDVWLNYISTWIYKTGIVLVLVLAGCYYILYDIYELYFERNQANSLLLLLGATCGKKQCCRTKGER
jgi:predicted HAD superfamily hydrolase